MRSADRDAVVTGLGVVSPVGNSLATFWDGIVAGRTGIGSVTLTPTDRLAGHPIAEVRDFDPASHFPGRSAALLDRFAQLGVVAAREAVADSGLDLDREDREGIATIIGTGVGGLHTLDDAFLGLYGRGGARVPPLTIPRMMANAGASHVAMDLGLRGEAYTVASACASAAHAIGQARRLIAAGDAEIVVTGGAESCLTVGTIKAWEALRVMSDTPCRPFSADRAGMSLGEGAAMLVLESRRHAQERGARIYGRVAGFGATADAGDLVAPNETQVTRAIRQAMANAELNAHEIDYINAHGTGTVINDATEARAIHAALGERARTVAVSSSKGSLGHALGAAGALEAVVTLLAIHRGIVPPTANWTSKDRDIDLDVVPNVARQAPVRAALSNSFAFGGLNAVLAFAQP